MKLSFGGGVASGIASVMSTNPHQKRGKQDKGSDVAEKVVVAVKASKEIPKTALEWALTHVVKPGDCITFLVVIPAQSSGVILYSICVKIFFFISNVKDY